MSEDCFICNKNADRIETLESDRDTLKEEVARLIGCWTEIDKLKAELETWRIDCFTWEGRADEFQKYRDRWKALAGKMADELEQEHDRFIEQFYSRPERHSIPDCRIHALLCAYQSAINESTKGELHGN